MNEHKFFLITENDLKGQKLFISEAFDAEDDGTVWHRLKITGDLEETESVTISVYASDTKKDDVTDDCYWKKSYVNPDDIPLYEYTGRYLWLRIEFTASKYKQFRARIYFPANSFTRYLPSVYQSNDINSFFSRYVALFQNIYLDIDEIIMQFQKLLDPLATDKKHLERLYKWLSCEEYYLLPEDKRGEFLLYCTGFYKNLGTKECISSFIAWLCGQKPLVVEYFEYEDYIEQERIKTLYGDEPFLFTIILKGSGLDRKITPFIKPLLNKIKPAYTECNLEILEDRILLDGFSYLGINSYIY